MSTLYLLFTTFSILFTFLLRPALALDDAYGQIAPSCDLPTASSPAQKFTLSEYASRFGSNGALKIACGHHVTVGFGVEYVFRNGLEVSGLLEFSGSSSVETVVKAPYIMVRGHLRVGSASKPITSKLRFELLDSVNELTVPNLSANKLFGQQLKFGRKAFVVYGGSVEIYGEEPRVVYTRLAKTASRGDKVIELDHKDVNVFRPGDKIALAPTQGREHGVFADVVVVDRVAQSASGATVDVFLRQPLSNYHDVRSLKLTDGTRREIVMAAEVAQISRSVQVVGLDVTGRILDDPDVLEEWWQEATHSTSTGHFVVAHSETAVVVRGVEFIGMGQPGIKGRYPVHMHFLADVPKGSVLSGNAVHHALQRCIVVHATNRLTVRGNVAVRSRGHCILTEDGLEMENVFDSNVVFSIKPELKNIDLTDSLPTAFWMATPTNKIVNSVAAGAHVGFWYEVFIAPRGMTVDVKLPGYNTTDMQKLRFAGFHNNVAHHAWTALATYPEGLHPKKGSVVLQNFLGYSADTGWKTDIGSKQVLRNSLLLDIGKLGILTTRIAQFRISNVVIGGPITEPERCYRTEPWKAVHLESNFFSDNWFFGLAGSKFTKLFVMPMHGSGADCKRTVAVYISAVNSFENGWLPSSTTFSKLRIDPATGVGSEIEVVVPQTGKQYRQIAFKVNKLGGSKLKGYIVGAPDVGANVIMKQCKKLHTSVLKDNSGRMYFCKKACYRHIALAYKDVDGTKTKLKITDKDGTSFVETPVGMFSWNYPHVDRHITKIMPAGSYTVTLLDRNTGAEIAANRYDHSIFWQYRPDSKLAKPACKKNVEFVVQGQKVVAPN